MSRLPLNIRKLLTLTGILLACLCFSGCARQVRNVLVVWKTTSDDAVYHQYHRQIKKEFRSRGIRVRLTDCFLESGKYGGLTLPQRLSLSLDEAERNGHELDLILAYGDFSHHLVMLTKDERLDTVPVVSFAIFGKEINGRPQERNVVLIRDSITVKENLDFMRLVFSDSNRVISLLDTRSSWVDRQMLASMSGQMACLDTSKYFCGLGLKCSVQDLDDAAAEGKTVLYALSLDNTAVNRNPDTGELFSATWAFFPQKSDNRVLMVKHDQTAEMLQLNPDFMPYCTAVAEGFETFGNCIGGHFSPFDIQVKDAVDMAVRIWDGAEMSEIPESWHHRDFYANWDVLRGQMPLGRMPGYVNVRNTRLSDSKPALARDLRILMMLSLFLFTLGLMAVLYHYVYRNFLTRRELARVSKESIERMESLEMLLKGTNSVSWTIVNGRIVYENDGTGLRNYMPLSERHSQSNAFYKEKLENFFAIEMPGNYSLQIERRDLDGIDRWYELRMSVVETLDGIRKSGITINIDEEKRMEASLHEAHRKLALADERENFISAMSHEMRTPLNSIVGFSQIMTTPGMECSREELVEFGTAIEDSNQELMKIIEDMLALTHMDNSNIRMDIKEYRVSSIFDRFERERVGYENVHDRVVRYHKGPEGSSISVDLKLLDTVWKNLVGNALKFSGADSTVSVGWTESRTSVRLYVSDEGIGIDKSSQDIIFNRFYQVDHFTQGTGLGLALAKEYVTRMGGSIIVDSEPGVGSTFYIRFPKNEGGRAI